MIHTNYLKWRHPHYVVNELEFPNNKSRPFIPINLLISERWEKANGLHLSAINHFGFFNNL